MCRNVDSASTDPTADRRFGLWIEVGTPEPLGVIRIGEFTERFGLDLRLWAPDTYRRQWLESAEALVAGRSDCVAFMSWAAPPAVRSIRRAWRAVLHGSVVRVQEFLYVPDDMSFEVDDAGVVVDHRELETTTGEGHPISEWRTTIDAVREFVESRRK